MKTNPLTSKLNNLRQALRHLWQTLRRLLCAQPNSPASLAEGGGGKGAGGGLGTQPQRSKGRFAKYLIPTAILLLFFLLISLVACKSPATLTNDTQHRTRDSNYHATLHRIETHDTIVIGIPSTLPLCRGSRRGSCEGRGGSPLVRISDRKITLHDTIYICRTDTLLRTQTITQKERYIPPFYRFCAFSFVTFATIATLVFSIRLLLRYL